MKANPETAAYCLLNTGRTQTAILSPRMKLGVKYKVDAKNYAPPYDSLVVDAWTVQEDGVLWFYFEDGYLGHNVSFSFDEAKRQVLDESDFFVVNLSGESGFIVARPACRYHPNIAAAGFGQQRSAAISLSPSY